MLAQKNLRHDWIPACNTCCLKYEVIGRYDSLNMKWKNKKLEYGKGTKTVSINLSKTIKLNIIA